MIVGAFGLAPSEFWEMTPAEVNLLIDSKRPKHIGGIHEDDIANMLNRRQDLIDKGVKVL